MGGGSKAQPLFGAGGVGAKRLMRWAWTPCLACNAPEGSRRAGAIYQHLGLSDAEISQRAQLATAKAPYREKLRDTLKRSTTAAPRAESADSGKLTELLETNRKLTEQVTQLTQQLSGQSAQFLQMNESMSRMAMQVGSLLEDNAKLRKELETKNANPHATSVST